MDHNPTDFIFLTSFKTDLTKSTKAATFHFSPINVCFENDRQLCKEIDWLCCFGNWWVIHSLHAAATTYAIFRHMAWCILISSHVVHKVREVYIVALLKYSICYFICLNVENIFKPEGKFIICAWIKHLETSIRLRKDNSLFVHG